MILYNFFTEPVSDLDKIEELKYCFEELKTICNNVQLVEFNKGLVYYSIIGQLYGDDTSIGDLDLIGIFGKEIKYTFFDAFCNKINNIE